MAPGPKPNLAPVEEEVDAPEVDGTGAGVEAAMWAAAWVTIEWIFSWYFSRVTVDPRGRWVETGSSVNGSVRRKMGTGAGLSIE